MHSANLEDLIQMAHFIWMPVSYYINECHGNSLKQLVLEIIKKGKCYYGRVRLQIQQHIQGIVSRNGRREEKMMNA